MKERETHFSWMRTRMSVERTLLAWVRTAAALIGFGFSMFQLIDHAGQVGVGSLSRDQGTLRTIALSLVAVGVAALIVALTGYRMMLHHLSTGAFADIADTVDRPMVTPATIVAVLLALTGAVTLAALVLRTAAV